jgi:hypothetical protein
MGKCTWRYDDRGEFNLPPHGSRKRYRVHGCRCVACIKGPHGGDLPEVLTWPYKFLDRKAGTQIEAWYEPEVIANWRKNGLTDYEADRVCLAIGLLPFQVFPGYIEAGLDCEMYP